MSKQKFDSKTTKKLISTYKNTISHYTAENEMLLKGKKDLIIKLNVFIFQKQKKIEKKKLKKNMNHYL